MKTIRKTAQGTANSQPKKRSQRSTTEWCKLAERELQKIIAQAITIPAVKKLGPKPATAWTASVSLIGAPAMTRLNSTYRGKNRPTDVLSFNSPEIFQKQGLLGELVICLPVLKRQARELKHTPELELKVLLVHGLLHLLGMDHELGPKQAVEQAKYEQKILEKLLTGRSKAASKQGQLKATKMVRGLIQRAE
ncbi:MAG: rRNA maturation RNase YbeY [Bdellovibrionia bacterium]